MLDYKKLAKEIDSFIESIDKDFVQEWLDDRYQLDDDLSELLSGKEMNISSEEESYELEYSSFNQDKDKFTTEDNYKEAA